MVILAVDLGLARTGIAVSDEGEIFAFPKTVVHEYNADRLVEKIAALAKDYGAGKIVVGYPVNMDGSAGERAQTCKELADRIREASGLEVVLRDERLTTVAAYAVLNENNVRGKKRKEIVDAEAACQLLQDYLDFCRHARKD
ncbi:MAG: Holliday junction resolvase RuvX [Clostridia bacterium]|nr:Holliday junction resolvase RuvX [Clostridia bacterium]